jgi:UDP-N-acetylmuramoylalanine--D-glutamate ligase
MERIKSNREILDFGAGIRIICADHAEIALGRRTVAGMAPGIDLNGKRVLVIGLARTGIATALFASNRGAIVTGIDSRAEHDLAESAEKLRIAGVRLEFGQPSARVLDRQHLVIPSPGVPADAPILQKARELSIPVWSEIELAHRFLDGKLIGITGSNGKTTTTSLLEHILRSAGYKTKLAGNIGTPLIAQVSETTEDTFTVAELSSFQLELIETFRPNVALFLNLTPDHLDRHRTLAAYGAAKARIFENQTPEDSAILNADDPESAKYAPLRPQVYWFGRKTNLAQGAFVRNGKIIFRRASQAEGIGHEEEILDSRDIPLPGAHNLENVLAATVAARIAGVLPAQIARGVRSFAGVEHRIEFVAEIEGVRYYNDSKATNVDATLKALEAFAERIVVILGGKDKDSDYTLLRPTLREKAILALLIGTAAQKIENQIEGSVAIKHAETLEHAVEFAAQAAHPGDIVLLSPACASFDQFQNYEHRGRVFKDLVHQLQRNMKNPAHTEKRNAETFGK